MIRPIVSVTLVTWFTLLGLANTVIHAHAGGDRTHTHRSGSTPFDGSSGPVHRHHLLFGFDLGSCLDADQLVDGSFADNQQPDPPADFTSDPTVARLVGQSNPEGVAEPSPAAVFVDPCPFACRAVSGVRLI
jgi:hypothetical protein